MKQYEIYNQVKVLHPLERHNVFLRSDFWNILFDYIMSTNLSLMTTFWLFVLLCGD